MILSQSRINKGLWWDRAWRLVEGCNKVSDGCRLCWAEQQAHMRSHQSNPKIQEQYSGVTDENGEWNGNIRLLEQNLELPLRVKKPTVWAIWNDFFHEKVTIDFIDSAIDIMERCPQHIFLALTKRPENIEDKLYKITVDNPFRMLGGGDYVKNLWIGVTIEKQKYVDRIEHLLAISVAKIFLCLEPLLEEIDLGGYLGWIDWVIVGGQTGHKASPMHPDWVRNIRDQCIQAEIPFFFKQFGEWIQSEEPQEVYSGKSGFQTLPAKECFIKVGKRKTGRLLDGGEWSEFPEV